MGKWTPEVIIAVILIVGGIALRCVGFDGEIWALVGVASGFLFGNGYQKVKSKRQIDGRK